jgi:hypothetical protein
MKTKVFLVLGILAIFFKTSFAQENEKRFGFELSGGASLATKDLSDAELKTGLGFEGIFHYRFMPHTGVYAGWGWNKFGSDESFAGKDIDFEETGYVFGLQFKHPLSKLPVSYFLRAGGLYNHIEIENAEGDIIKDSGHELGFQLAGGFDIELGKNWSLTPGIKFNSMNCDVENNGVKVPLELNYLSFRVGILKNF